MRSAEARRLWKLKRGIRALENAVKKCDGEGDLDRRRESSLSFRLCVAYEVRTSSRMTAICCVNSFSWSALSSSINVGGDEVRERLQKGEFEAES